MISVAQAVRHIERAVEQAASGEHRGALAGAEAALGCADPRVRLLAVELLFVLGRYRRAFAALGAIPRGGRVGLAAQSLEVGWTERLGRLHELPALIARAEAQLPHARWRALLADKLAQGGSHARAARELERALALEPRSASLHVQHAQTLIRLGQTEAALAALRRAVALRADAPVRLEAARLGLQVGAFDDAERWAAEARALAPERPEGPATLARLALFRGDLAQARAAGAAIPDSADAWVVQAAIASLAGDMTAALAACEQALARDAQAYEAEAWRAEALLALGRPAEALRSADRAVIMAPGLLVSARVVHPLAVMQIEGIQGGASAFEELLPMIAALCPDIDPDEVRRDVGAAQRALRRVLAALRGNRTIAPTRLDEEGRLVLALPAHGPRYASRAALQRIATDDGAEVLAALDEVVAAYPDSALPLAHRGELNLWLGHLDRARADLEQSVERWPYTRWPYIGLCALETLVGDPEKGLATCALGVQRMGSEGPAVFVHRGEARRRLGQLDEAVTDLERACQLNPTRLSAPINLSLARLARGEIASGRALFRDLVERAAGLLGDAASELGLDAFDHDLGEGEMARVLERCLVMMRGNRSSSCLTYFTGETLRLVVLDASGGQDRQAILRRLREGARRLAEPRPAG